MEKKLIYAILVAKFWVSLSENKDKKMKDAPQNLVTQQKDIDQLGQNMFMMLKISR